MSVLIIAEKPSVAGELAKIVGATKGGQGYKEGNGYIVSWCIGHLVELAPPDAYDPAYKTWRLDDLPIIPDAYQMQISDRTAGQFKILKELMGRDDVTELVCATDAGREGELIYRLVYHEANCQKPFKRLWISSMEEKSIRDGLAAMKDGKEYDNLYKAALCRQRADWLIGINVTRLYSRKYKKTLSAGRVQTPTVNLVVKRQVEIDSFIPQTYYNIIAGLSTFEARTRVDDKATADEIISRCTGKEAVVTTVTKEEKKENPQALYDLTSLQREANRLLGYSAKQTLELMQTLYDAKLATYPRTDSRYITADMADSTMNLINELINQGLYANLVEYNPKNAEISRLVNDGRVTDHHAILPTASVTTEKYNALSTAEKNILTLLMYRLLTAADKPHIYTATKAELDIEGTVFEAAGKEVLEIGFKAIESKLAPALTLPQKKEGKEKKEKQDKALPPMAEGNRFTVASIKAEKEKTQPPKPYTEDTLLAAMENAGKDIEDDDLKAVMKDRGLGTPATRADIIENIISKGYVVRDKKSLLATEQAKIFMGLVAEKIKQPELTADWESKLAEIQGGKYSDSDFMAELTDFLFDLVKEETSNHSPEKTAGIFARPAKEAVGVCPKCKKNVVEWEKSFSCESGKGGCGFVIWKSIAGKVISKAQAQKLMKKGKTDLIKGFHSNKSGKDFDAFIVMKADGTTGFEFESKTKKVNNG